MLGSFVTLVAALAVWGASLVFRFYRPGKRQFFGTATIAHKAGPLIDRYVVAGSRLYITGGSGLPLFQDGYPWRRNFLEKWAKAGCTIYYLLAEPEPEALKVLDALGRKYPGLFQVEVIDYDKVTEDTELHRIVEKMRTFHFVLAEKPSLMWIERYHPPDQCVAFDCEFVSPEFLEDDSRYERLREILKNVREKCTKPGSTLEATVATA